MRLHVTTAFVSGMMLWYVTAQMIVGISAMKSETVVSTDSMLFPYINLSCNLSSVNPNLTLTDKHVGYVFFLLNIAIKWSNLQIICCEVFKCIIHNQCNTCIKNIDLMIKIINRTQIILSQIIIFKIKNSTYNVEIQNSTFNQKFNLSNHVVQWHVALTVSCSVSLSVAPSITCTFEDQFICGYTYVPAIPGFQRWNRLQTSTAPNQGPIVDHTLRDGTGE